MARAILGALSLDADRYQATTQAQTRVTYRPRSRALDHGVLDLNSFVMQVQRVPRTAMRVERRVREALARGSPREAVVKP